MGITSAIVLFAVIWFMAFLIILPLGLQTQGEAGEIVPGTHGSSPANLNMRRKVWMTSIWAVGLWVVIAGTILSGLITVRDLDWFDRMATPEVSLTDETDG
jgi:predicted secreted protein